MRPIEREPHASPRAVEVVVDVETFAAAVRTLRHARRLRGGSRSSAGRRGPASCRGRCARRGGRGRRGRRLRCRRVELHEQALQDLRLELRIGRARLPLCLVLRRRRVHLDHAAVTDEDLGGVLRRAFDTRAVLVHLARGIDRVEHAAQGTADDILRQLGPVLGPRRLEDARRRVRLLDLEPDARPEIDQDGPYAVRRQVHREPALVALPFDLRDDAAGTTAEPAAAGAEPAAGPAACWPDAVIVCGRSGTTNRSSRGNCERSGGTSSGDFDCCAVS